MSIDIIAPCKSGGEVNSVWKPENNSLEESLYIVADDEAKDAECRCWRGRCCVNGQNKVITGIVLTAGGPENLE